MNSMVIGPMTVIAILMTFLLGLVVHQHKQIKIMQTEIIVLKEECIGVPGVAQ